MDQPTKISKSSGSLKTNNNKPSQFNPATPSPVERFRANMDAIFDLINELVVKANQQGCTVVSSLMVSLGTIYLKSQNPDELITSFIDRSYLYWDQIHIKDEKFFNENLGTVFSGISKSNSDAFLVLATAKDKSGKPIISEEDREGIWTYIRSFVKISIHYIHEKRIPDVMKKEGKLMAVYRQNFKPDIKLDEHRQKWEIKFIFRRRK